MSLQTTLFEADEAAEIVGIKPALLKLWLATGKFTIASVARRVDVAGVEPIYFFTDKDIARLKDFAVNQGEVKPNNVFVDDGTQETFTVQQIASLWQLSTDTIQRMFQDEPGVMPLGDKNPRGKKRRVTLRIPRAVMDRVKRRRANP